MGFITMKNHHLEEDFWNFFQASFTSKPKVMIFKTFGHLGGISRSKHHHKLLVCVMKKRVCVFVQILPDPFS